jgi:HK97 family phage portal protein
MQLLAKISDIIAGKKADAGAGSIAADTAIWQRYGLSRTARFRYTSSTLLDAYAAHELVYACINKLADVMNDAELAVEKKNGKGEWEPISGHPLSALFRRPNQSETGRDFRRLMVQSEQAAAIFYSEIVRSRAGQPVELHVLNPNRIEPILNGARTDIAYYRFIRADGQYYDIQPENMLIRRRVDLVNRFFGLSPLDVALKSVNSDLGMTDYIDAFFESDGTPTGILKILNATVSDTKKESIVAQWMRKFSRNGTNRKGIAVLDQNAEFQRLGANLDELAADSVTDRFESRICSVFGVPPILVGSLVGLKHTTTNATAKAALRDFWDNKVNPELATLREWLTWFVLPLFEDIEQIKAEKIRVSWDISHVGFLREDADGLHKRARENFKAGLIKLNEAREAIGLEPDDAVGDDYYVQPSTLIAISPERRAAEAEEEPQAPPPQLLNPGEPISDDENNDDDDDDDDEKGDHLPSLEKKTFDFEGLTLRREPTDIEKLLGLKTIVADLESEKSRLIKILAKFRLSLIDQAAEKLDELTPETAYTLTLVPDTKIRKDIAKAIRSAFSTGRAQVIRELNNQNAGKNGGDKYITKDERDDDALEFLDELVDGSISKIINEISQRAVNEYLTLKLLLDYTVQKLRELLLGQSEKFIERIAGSAANAAIQSGRSAEAENQKDKWDRVIYSAVLDANTCGPCEEADGEEASDPADLPAAPNPECEGRDNCRCFHVFVAA